MTFSVSTPRAARVAPASRTVRRLRASSARASPRRRYGLRTAIDSVQPVRAPVGLGRVEVVEDVAGDLLAVEGDLPELGLERRRSARNAANCSSSVSIAASPQCSRERLRPGVPDAPHQRGRPAVDRPDLEAVRAAAGRGSRRSRAGSSRRTAGRREAGTLEQRPGSGVAAVGVGGHDRRPVVGQGCAAARPTGGPARRGGPSRSRGPRASGWTMQMLSKARLPSFRSVQ